MTTTLRKMYAKIEEKIRNRYWEIELLTFFKLKKTIKDSKIEKQFKLKKSRDIHPRNIPTNFEKIQTLVAELEVLTDGRTDPPTTRHGNRSSGPKNYRYEDMTRFTIFLLLSQNCRIISQ